MEKLLLIAALSVAAIGAQAKQPVDNFGVSAITQANFVEAEAQLTRTLRKAPFETEALLNLAYVYRATGRAQDATALYDRVLRQPDLVLDGDQGKSTTSHRAARLGLERIARLANR